MDPFLFVQLVFVIAAREMLQEKCCIKNCCILEWKHSYWNRLVSILSRVSILWPSRFLFYDFQATGSMDGNKPTLIPFWISLFQAFQIMFSPKIEIDPFSVMQWNLLRQIVYCRNRNFLNPNFYPKQSLADKRQIDPVNLTVTVRNDYTSHDTRWQCAAKTFIMACLDAYMLNLTSIMYF